MPDHAEQPVVPIQDDADGAFPRLFREGRGDVGGVFGGTSVCQPEKNILKRQYIGLGDSKKYAMRPVRSTFSLGSILNSGGSSDRKQAELLGLEIVG